MTGQNKGIQITDQITIPVLIGVAHVIIITIVTEIIAIGTMTVTIQGIEEITEMIAGAMTAGVFGIGDLWISSFAFND